MGMTLRQFGGKVYTINVSRPELSAAAELVKRAGLDNVELLQGSSLKILPTLLPTLEFDMMFIDGYHDYTHSMGEFRLAEKHITKESGIVLFDDAGVIHSEGRHDGGVPRTIKESGAALARSRFCVGVVTFGSAIMVDPDISWTV